MNLKSEFCLYLETEEVLLFLELIMIVFTHSVYPFKTCKLWDLIIITFSKQLLDDTSLNLYLL